MGQSEVDTIEESVRFVARHYQPGRFDSRKAWPQMRERLGIATERQSLTPLWRVAVVAIVVITAGILYLTAERGDTLIAGYDHTEFTLPDQTRIVMQKEAELKYEKDFDKTERRVSMQGEIAFAVTRDEAKPFIVSTPAAQIEVLGTEFTVIADNVETQLSVKSGIVRFTPDDLQVPLLCTAGMTARYNAADETIKVASPDSEMKISARTQSLSFDNIALKEVVRILSHFYKVKIELPGSESELTFSSSFTQKSIIEIIDIINITLDSHIAVIIP